MRTKLLRYKLGLGVIGLFTVGLLIVVLMQASATKQDTETYHKASAIADKLQAYTLSKNEVPASLAAANIADVPSTISYTKVSTSSYKFCVTYRATSSNFDATSAISDVTSGHYGSSAAPNSQGQSSYLYVPSAHHKGQNCQTIKVDIYPAGFYQDECGYDPSFCDNSSNTSNSYTQ